MMAALLFVSAHAEVDIGAKLFPWRAKCIEVGCLISIDVLRGISGEATPPDVKDVREYITINVAVARASKQVDFISFQVDPRASRDTGIYIGFMTSSGSGKDYKLTRDEGLTRLHFEQCTDQFCTARVVSGDAGTLERFDDKFQSATGLWILYERDGHAYRTMVLLSPYRAELQRVLAQEFTSKP